jgi:hypothetical protein
MLFSKIIAVCYENRLHMSYVLKQVVHKLLLGFVQFGHPRGVRGIVYGPDYALTVLLQEGLCRSILLSNDKLRIGVSYCREGTRDERGG